MKEIWKSIPNTNNNYLISNLGNVKSRHNKYTHRIDNEYHNLKPKKTKTCRDFCFFSLLVTIIQHKRLKIK